MEAALSSVRIISAVVIPQSGESQDRNPKCKDGSTAGLGQLLRTVSAIRMRAVRAPYRQRALRKFGREIFRQRYPSLAG